MLGKGTDRFEDPRDKRVTGESGSLLTNLAIQLDKPTGDERSREERF